MAQQTIDIGSAPNDGTGDPIRDAFDKCNDNFTELYTGLTGLLDFKGSTDTSANPNYPAASKGDFYVVSVAGKIGGASGIDVEVGDAYFAEADNAGGTQAAVGTNWSIIQGNTTGAGAGIDVEDEGVSEAVGATVLNFIGAGVTAADAGGGVVDITIPGGGVSDLDDLSDVDLTGASTGDVLTKDVGGDWVAAAPSGGGDLVLIDSFTFTGAEATKTFSSIPGTYRDLVLVFNGRSDRAGQVSSTFGVRLNGDSTAANYYSQNINGSGATANGSAASGSVGYMLSQTLPAATAPAAYAAAFEAKIIRYAGTTFQKFALADHFFATAASAAGHIEVRSGGHWLNTAAVTSIEFFDTNTANFTSGSTLELYGRG